VGIVKAREARPGDRPAIEALVNAAYYTTPALWRWDRHLPDEGFIVVEGGTHGKRGRINRIRGALLASSDASSVAWIRLAAVDHDLDIGRWLDLSLPPILRTLSDRGVRELAWMDHGEWAHTYLKTRGFSPLMDVITLSKTDRHLPEPPVVSMSRAKPRDLVEPTPQRIILRPATDADLAAIVSIDRAAFEPHWWRSEATLRRMAATASRFTVATWGGKVVGYTEQELHPPAAHLNRIAIHPRIQGRGAGKVLLHNVLSALWQSGARTVSLNTQRHNQRSRRLYHRFGFQPTGDVVTVWTLRPLAPQPTPASGSRALTT
jgi:ribosomal-protein-alanine N-acetyltransferase